jgi:hypothetical protein
MSADEGHNDVQPALASEALSALAGSERERVMAHVAACPGCARDLAGLRGAASLLAWLAPERPMEAERSARLRARLLVRAAADRIASNDGLTGDATERSTSPVVEPAPIPMRTSAADVAPGPRAAPIDGLPEPSGPTVVVGAAATE